MEWPQIACSIRSGKTRSILQSAWQADRHTQTAFRAIAGAYAPPMVFNDFPGNCQSEPVAMRSGFRFSPIKGHEQSLDL